MSRLVSKLLAALLAFGVAASLAAQEQPKKEEEVQKKEGKKEDSAARLAAMKEKWKQLESEARKLHEELKKESDLQLKKADEELAKARQVFKDAKGDRAKFEQASEAMRKANDARMKAMKEMTRLSSTLWPRSLPEQPLNRDKELGMRTEALPAALAAQLGLKADRGRVVSHVEKGSPAAKAGLAVHDVLLQIDKKDVPSSPTGFRKSLDGLAPGAVVEVTVTRQSKEQKLQMTVPGKAEPKKKDE